MSVVTDRHPVVWGGCVHEAGHAIAAIAVGLAVTRVTVRPDGSGRTSVAESLGGLPATDLLFTLAGPVAQRRFAPESPCVWSPEDDGGDFRIAQAILRGSVSCWNEWLRRTDALVDRHRAAILSLAHDLFDPWREVVVSGAAVEEHFHR